MTMLYPIVLETEENGTVSAYAPGLPVYAAADSHAQAERAIRGVLTTIADTNFERSLPDAAHGHCHLLPALGLTIERLTAFAEVIERCGDRIVLGYRPVKAVCLQPVVLSVNRAIAPQDSIEA